MKRIVFLLLLAVAWPLFAPAGQATINGVSWTYSVLDSTKKQVKIHPTYPARLTGDVVIPSTIAGYTVTWLGGSVIGFEGSEMVSVTIPATMIGFDVANPFGGLSSLASGSPPPRLKEVKVASGSSSFCTVNGVLFTKDRKKLITYPPAKEGSSYAVPSGTEEIVDNAFSECLHLTSVSIPEGVRRIGGAAFTSWKSNTSWLSDGSQLTTVSLPSSLSDIGGDPFSSESITTVTVPGGFTMSELFPRSYRTSLSSVTVRSGTTSLVDEFCQYCSGLTTLSIPDGVSTIGKDAFAYCTALTTVSIPDGVNTIGEDAFRNCTALTTISIPNSVTSIGRWAFTDTDSIQNVTVPTRFVLSSLFPDSTASIRNVTMAAGAESVENPAFLDGLSVDTLTLSTAFRDASNLTTDVGSYAVGGNDRFLTEYETGALIRIEGDGEDPDVGLTWWLCRFPARKTGSYESHRIYIESRAFENTRLSVIRLPWWTVEIGDDVFLGSTSLTDVYLPSAFKGDTSRFSAPAGCRFHFPVELTVRNQAGETTNTLFGVSTDTYWPGDTVEMTQDPAVDDTGQYWSPTGWSGSGSVPESGSGGSVSFVIEEDSTLTWKWARRYKIEIELEGPVSFPAFLDGTRWVSENQTYRVSLNVSVSHWSMTLSGDTDGVTQFGSGISIAFAPYNRRIHVLVEEEEFATLTVESEHGTPTPGVGVHSFAWDSLVPLSVDAIDDSDAAGGVRWVCRGWSGDGGIARSGTTNAVTADLSQNTGVRWEWDRYYRVDVLVEGGRANPSSQWVKEGTKTTFSLEPDYVLYDYEYDGLDANETLNLSATRVLANRPRTIRVRFIERKAQLVISSPHGTAVPSVGSHEYSYGRTVEASVSRFEEGGAGIQYECTGWQGSGSVPATGSGTNLSFSAKRPYSSLEWTWATNVWTDISVVGAATASFVPSWRRIGETIVVFFQPDSDDWFWRASGDADGMEVESRYLSLPADRPRTVSLRVVPWSVVFAGEIVERSLPGWDPVESSARTDGWCLSCTNSSAVEIRFSGSGSLSFDWSLAAARGDYLRAYLDGEEKSSISRTAAWRSEEWTVPDGDHVVRWVFEKATSGDCSAFLDSVSWRPERSLAVSSAYGTPVPAAGNHRILAGETVSASVAEPAAADGTRHVCTGWTGTGSVPRTGSGNAVSFVLAEDSSLTWKWRTDHWTDVALTSGGSATFEPAWIRDGQWVSISFEPQWTLFDVSMSGDTAGVSVSGKTLSFLADRPRTIRISVSERKLPLDVSSAHGSAVPAPGTHLFSLGDTVEASVAEPSAENGVRRVCTGWTGAGSVPASGTGTSVSFAMSSSSSLRWNWRTDVLLSFSSSGPVSFDEAERWAEQGGTATVRFRPAAGYVEYELSGDSDGVVLDTAARTLSIPADRPRSIVLSATKVLSLAESLDAPGILWETGEDCPWRPQFETTVDGEDAAAAGAADGDLVSFLSATNLVGPGTLSWTWKMEDNGDCGLDVFLDGELLDEPYLAATTDWTPCSLAIEGDGTHVVRFEFWNVGSRPDDRAWLDRFSWTGAGLRVSTQTTPAAVPYAWLDEWGLAPGGDYESAAWRKAPNGRNEIWECYVAGLDPTDPEASFQARIDVSNGTPRVSWTPDLGDRRDYEVQGAPTLGSEWGAVDAGSRFFRVRVRLKDEE